MNAILLLALLGIDPAAYYGDYPKASDYYAAPAPVVAPPPVVVPVPPVTIPPPPAVVPLPPPPVVIPPVVPPPPEPTIIERPVVPDPPPPAQIELPEVYFYTLPNCPPCERMKAEIKYSKTLRFRKGEPDSWLASQAEAFPHLRWKINGKWTGAYHGWSGLDEFLNYYQASVASISSPPVSDNRLATGAAAHTPMSEVVRVIGLLPKPEIAFADLGCGYDARWCIAAAERWGCKCIGIEIDPGRAAAARERVRNLGLDHLITIVQGDAGDVPISADVGVAYLFPELLERLRPRLESFKVFASYIHQPPGLNATKNGDTWFYRRQEVRQQVIQESRQAGAVWQGAIYNQPLCNSPHCAMCNSIRRQLGIR